MLKIWDKQETIIQPNGAPLDREGMFAEFPFSQVAEVLLEQTPLGITYAVNDIDILKSNYGIDPALYGEEAIAAIVAAKEIQNAPAGPSAEERIAAAMEFQNLMNL
jgi:hypothetical protein